jgi:C4-dicarboxylate-specific signal transduction histidine kinase
VLTEGGAKGRASAARREAGRFGAVVAVAFFPYDALVPQRPALAMALRAAAVALLGVAWWWLARSRRRSAREEQALLERHRAVAELEESERRRRSSERLALIGRLASGVGHEINNPLSAVKGNVACALEELERLGAAPTAREALAEAMTAAERIAWITSDMRALTADASAPLVACEVRAAICDALERWAERLGPARVVLDLEPDLPPVRSEPRLLADAIGQLVFQAAACAAPAGQAPPTVRIGARRVRDGIEIAIDDEGPRIPAHVLSRIFEPFAAQGEVRGAGLGLALPLTRELAERGGGSVGASWHEGGNRYVLTLAASVD